MQTENKCSKYTVFVKSVVIVWFYVRTAWNKWQKSVSVAVWVIQYSKSLL